MDFDFQFSPDFPPGLTSVRIHLIQPGIDDKRLQSFDLELTLYLTPSDSLADLETRAREQARVFLRQALNAF